MEKFNVKVEREMYESKAGRQNYAYFVRGVVRGQEVKIGVIPPDVGGYTVLDIVFNGAKEADLVVTPFQMKDEQGKIIAGNTYAVRSVDEETGEIYECKIKPSRTSDKTMLGMLLR